MLPVEVAQVARRAGVAVQSLATTRATFRAAWSAALMARSAARVRTSRQSGITKATTTADVVARTSHEIRLPHQAVGRDPTSRTPTPRTLMQVARLGRRLPELAAQPRQVDVDGPVGAAVRLPPNLGEQLALGDHLARPVGQGEQQVELLAGELERRSVECRGAGALVDDEVADPDRLAGRPAVPPRRSTARIRAATWSAPNGLTT